LMINYKESSESRKNIYSIEKSTPVAIGWYTYLLLINKIVIFICHCQATFPWSKDKTYK
jgi:hypothetical protein